MRTIFEILLLLTVISVGGILITENRHPVKTFCWILIICILPVFGLVLWFFFGTSKRNKRLIDEKQLQVLKSIVVRTYPDRIEENIQGNSADLSKLLWMTGRSIPLKGNSLKVYTVCQEMYDDLVRDLKTATDHIHFEFFKFEDDQIGRRIGEILIAKARAGVQVRVQYDHVANYFRGKFYNWLKEGGVEVEPFLKVSLPFLSSDTNYRNHRKIVIIDGRIGYAGGMNIAQRYATGIKRGNWRDTHFRVVGPAVSEMQVVFLTDWCFSRKELLDDQRFFPRVESDDNVTMQIASSGPMDQWNVTMQGMMRIITRAKSYVYIQSPYLIPTEPVMSALRDTALAGVDVRLMIPYHGDRGVIPALASRSYVAQALEAGVKVYFYNGGYLHAKTIVSDDEIVTIGSTNLDVRSFEQDFEINAFIYDSNLAVQMKEIFLRDQDDCSWVTAEQWAYRPKLEKVKESVARLFSPLL
ncbi:MAG: cardiolipin synthase [Rikenellaceae bacterium]|nr:cardiolipin synthase [Rikenellaceae bacterium]